MLETALPDKKKWAEQMKALMKYHNVTRGDIAEAMGVSYPTVSYPLSSPESVPHDKLKSIEDALRGIIYEMDEKKDS